MNQNEIYRLLHSLNGISGVSGSEQAVGEEIARHLTGCVDWMYEDALGNRFFVKKGRQNHAVLLTAHMDEIGFLVCGVNEDGTIRMLPVGFHDARLLKNQVMSIFTKSGEIVGVTGAGTPPHEQKTKTPPDFTLEDLVLDIGAKNREEALKMGVEIGNTISGTRGGIRLGQRLYCGRAVDNRAGCAAMIAAMKLLKERETQATVIACATVQEEIGAKGARAAGGALQPDLALSLDVCFAAEHGSGEQNRAYCRLGGGPAITLYDWSPGSLMGNIVPRRLYEALLETAARHGIPCQTEVTLDCGTDACELAVSGRGILTGGINIPCRYMHSAVGTVDLADIENTARLAAGFIGELEKPMK